MVTKNITPERLELMQWLIKNSDPYFAGYMSAIALQEPNLTWWEVVARTKEGNE